MKLFKKSASVVSLLSLVFLMTACGSAEKKSDDMAATVSNTELQNVEDIDQKIQEEDTLGASSSGRGH